MSIALYMISRALAALLASMLDLALVETVQKPVKFVRDIALRQRIAISVCRDGKAIGDSNPLRRQNGIQFAKRRGLAADKPDVVQSEFEE